MAKVREPGLGQRRVLRKRLAGHRVPLHECHRNRCYSAVARCRGGCGGPQRADLQLQRQHGLVRYLHGQGTQQRCPRPAGAERPHAAITKGICVRALLYSGGGRGLQPTRHRRRTERHEPQQRQQRSQLRLGHHPFIITFARERQHLGERVLQPLQQRCAQCRPPRDCRWQQQPGRRPVDLVAADRVAEGVEQRGVPEALDQRCHQLLARRLQLWRRCILRTQSGPHCGLRRRFCAAAAEASEL